VVLWDPACLVNVAALVAAVAVFVKVAKLIAVLAQIESLTALGIMASLSIPTTGVELDMGAVSPGVVEDIMTIVDFFCGHGVSRGIFKDHPWGQPIVGICLQEDDGTVMTLFLQLKQVLLHLGDTEGRVVDVHVEHTVVDDLHFEGVILLEGNGIINQLCEGLVGGECEFLLFC
jgi:hypothetical protein